MKKLLLITLTLSILSSCGGTDSTTNSNIDVSPSGVTNERTTTNNATDSGINLAIADNFCSNETKLKLLSTSLLSAFAVKGNGADLNYCGGSSELLVTDSTNFNIILDNYCVNFRNQQAVLNGTINGTVESGANFVSSIIPNLTITGDNLNLSVTGTTYNGRADDMFISLSIEDKINNIETSLENVSIKKGELDFGLFSFNNVGPYEFKFIDHFNEDLTKGMLFIYGEGEELLILTAENGIVTVVHKLNKKDPGSLIDSTSCNN